MIERALSAGRIPSRVWQGILPPCRLADADVERFNTEINAVLKRRIAHHLERIGVDGILRCRRRVRGFITNEEEVAAATQTIGFNRDRERQART